MVQSITMADARNSRKHRKTCKKVDTSSLMHLKSPGIFSIKGSERARAHTSFERMFLSISHIPFPLQRNLSTRIFYGKLQHIYNQTISGKKNDFGGNIFCSLHFSAWDWLGLGMSWSLGYYFLTMKAIRLAQLLLKPKDDLHLKETLLV